MLLFKGLKLNQCIEFVHVQTENLVDPKVVFKPVYHYIKDIERIHEIRLLRLSINYKNVEHVAKDRKYYMLTLKGQNIVSYKYDIDLMIMVRYVSYSLLKKTLYS